MSNILGTLDFPGYCAQEASVPRSREEGDSPDQWLEDRDIQHELDTNDEEKEKMRRQKSG